MIDNIDNFLSMFARNRVTGVTASFCNTAINRSAAEPQLPPQQLERKISSQTLSECQGNP
jgi:hypothetical protein